MRFFPKVEWVSAQNYSERLQRREWLWALFVFFMAMLPNFFIFSPVVALLLSAVVGLKFWVIFEGKNRAWDLYSLFLFFPLSFVLIVFASDGYYFVLLLLLMSACKLLEARNFRDIKILFLLEMLLMMSFLMFYQSIFMFLYLLVLVFLAFWVQVRLMARGSVAYGALSFKALFKLFVFSFLAMVGAFFTFPRMAPIWGIPNLSPENITGLPNEMTMDGMSSLARSDEISFRVQFEGEPPPASALYWRGPVLWSFDGVRWTQRVEDAYEPRQRAFLRGAPFSYVMTLAKNDLQWLPILELSQFDDQGRGRGRMRQGFSWQVGLSSYRRGEPRYHLEAYLDFELGEDLSPSLRALALALPNDYEIPKTRALAHDLYVQGGETVEGFAEAFFDYVRDNEFYYTMNPLPEASHVENFLFGSGYGFCQHYANAFAVAARTVGIPSRVVIGYQGGALNAFSGNFVVREENAHAWVELWSEEKGWVRFDPTAAVAPWRVEGGSVMSEGLEGEDGRAFFSRYAESYRVVAWLRNALDGVDTFWQNWVIHLSEERQFGIWQALRSLGGLFWGALLLFLAGALWFVYLYLKRRRTDFEDVLAKAVFFVLLRAKRCGLVRNKRESFAEFLRRNHNFIKDGALAMAVAEDYERFRYYEKGALKPLLAKIRSLRFKKV